MHKSYYENDEMTIRLVTSVFDIFNIYVFTCSLRSSVSEERITISPCLSLSVAFS